MDVRLLCVLCIVRLRSLQRADHSSTRSTTDCSASLCVIKKPRERGGHSPRWAAESEQKIGILHVRISLDKTHSFSKLLLRVWNKTSGN
jgi:hypothetical protein